MTKTFEELQKILDGMIAENYPKVIDLIKKSPVEIFRLYFEIKPDKKTQEEFGLNDDIQFIVDADTYRGEAQCKYYYKREEMQPDCLYLRPKNYHPVSILQMLLECIRQDTAKPDIKFLEKGEKPKLTKK